MDDMISGGALIYLFSLSQLVRTLREYMAASRLVIASQLCERKPTWRDDNGRETCWRELGGVVVGCMCPMEEKEWFDDNDAMTR